MTFIKPDEWQPAQGLILEKNAVTTVKSGHNILVVAGPGAGKTELLAQRACYLLQTNTCKLPKKILAISFKRDASINLKHRVKLRCGDALSRRFDSFTFDAFAKQLLDRFKNALPKDFGLPGGYDIFFSEQTIHDLYRGFDETAFYTNDTKMLVNLLTRHRYPLPQNTTLEQLATKVLSALLSRKPALLDFRILMRLAELIIRSNPKITAYLRQTYQYVFLDEFQDTTDVQYDFLKACFFDDKSDTILTAVGDDKQRIMLWANAKADVFPAYLKEMSAVRLNLQMNFRSAPKLVQLQNHLMNTLLGSTDTILPSPKWEPEKGEVLFHTFETLQLEAALLHQFIHTWIHKDGLNPRDIVLLVKQQVPVYAGNIITFLNQNGIYARDENDLQDILSEELTLYVINMIYVLFRKDNGREKEEVFTFLSIVNTEFEDRQLQRLNVKLIRFIKSLKDKYGPDTFDERLIGAIVDDIINFAGLDRIKSVYGQYKDRKYTEYRIQRLKGYFLDYYKQTKEVVSALDRLTGVDSIPVMTIHKSKGLEFHTVVFIGFEDGAFWSYSTQADEDKRAFFVAMSRAKERLVFTFCRQRKDKKGVVRQQKVEAIRDMFQALHKSGLLELQQHR